MGDPSYLRLVPASSANFPIDWTKIPEASKKFFLKRWGIDRDTLKPLPLPATINDLAKMLDQSKFFGYLEPDVLNILLDISEFGLTDPPDSWGMKAGPRFYMKYLENVWFLMFEPGKRDGVTGISADIRQKKEDYDDEDYEEKEAASDRALAEKYDLELCDVCKRFGTLTVSGCGNIAGWKASGLKSNLQFWTSASDSFKLELLKHFLAQRAQT